MPSINLSTQWIDKEVKEDWTISYTIRSDVPMTITQAEKLMWNDSVYRWYETMNNYRNIEQDIKGLRQEIWDLKYRLDWMERSIKSLEAYLYEWCKE